MKPIHPVTAHLGLLLDRWVGASGERLTFIL